MQLTLPVLVAGIVGLTLCACAPVERASVPATTSACTSGALNTVPFLSLPYDPTSNTTSSADGAAIPGDVWTDLQNAFAIAAAFQKQLCGLNGIFINPKDCR